MPLVQTGAAAATEDVAEANAVGLELEVTEPVGLLEGAVAELVGLLEIAVVVTLVGLAPSAVHDVYALLRAESTATPKRPSA